MASLDTRSVQHITVAEAESGQRLDNYLLRLIKHVPKTRLYKAIRKGEVRINRGRAKPESRLEVGDEVRIPPFGAPAQDSVAVSRVPQSLQALLARQVVLDEKSLLVIDKPSGIAVHGGSGINFGLIETLRAMYPEGRYLELVHRLDRDTSGLILLARKAAVLRDLHTQLRSDRVDKRYLALVGGKWPAHLKLVTAPLEKFALSSGERMVRVSPDGKSAKTEFRVIRRLPGATLIEAKPITGRTHQIRVHARHAGFPILGDDKYANEKTERLTRECGLERLFLHAHSLKFSLSDERFALESPLPEELARVIARLAQ
jgi:23S rRNA pseudouridine955/2504/2580 synthase